MMKILYSASLLVCAYSQIETASRDEIGVRNPSFKVFEEFHACKRLITEDGVIGCGSDFSSSLDFGPLVRVGNSDDSPQFDRPVTVVINENALGNAQLLTSLAGNEKVASILIQPASADEPITQAPEVLELLFTQPVALLSEKESALVDEALDENLERGAGNPLWEHAAAHGFFNGRVNVNSSFCLEIDQCDPLGGQSVWGVVKSNPVPDANTIVIAVKLDTNTLFHDLAFGASDVASGLIVSLAAAEFLSRVEAANLAGQVVFAAFQGESFDNIGSKRFFFDVETTCKGDNFDEESDTCEFDFIYSTSFNSLSVSNIGTFIVIDNVASFSVADPELSITLDDNADGNTPIGTRLTNIISSGANFANAELSTGIFNSLGAAFTGEKIHITGASNDNSAIGTRFDRAPTVEEGQQSLSTASLLNLARNLANSVLDDDDPQNVVPEEPTDLDKVAELEFCLTQNFACSLVTSLLNVTEDEFVSTFQESQFFTNRAPVSPSPPIFFSGIFIPNIIRRTIAAKPVELFVRNFLASRLSPGAQDLIDDTTSGVACVNDIQCAEFEESDDTDIGCEPNRKTSALCVSGKCVCSTVFFHDAVSQAIDVNGQGNNFGFAVNTNFPDERVFTEPRFPAAELNLFQQGTNVSIIILFVLGSVVTLASIVLTLCCIKRLKDTKYKLL